MNPFKSNHDHNQEEYQRRMDRLVATQQELAKETDRGMAILGAAMLDEKLKLILTNFLIQGKPVERLLSGPNAPVGTFSARLDMAYAVGLISKEEYQDAELIRKIRNDFAHKFELEFSFNNASISDRCHNFSVTKQLVEQSKANGISLDARTIFKILVGNLDYKWMFKEQHALQLRLEAPNWYKLLFPNATD